MTVKELIEELGKHDPEAHVYVHSEIDEGGDDAHGVITKEQATSEDEGLSFKADPPWTYGEIPDNFIVIM